VPVAFSSQKLPFMDKQCRLESRQFFFFVFEVFCWHVNEKFWGLLDQNRRSMSVWTRNGKLGFIIHFS